MIRAFNQRFFCHNFALLQGILVLDKVQVNWYYVLKSEKRYSRMIVKNLGGPYESKYEAEKRLRQVEYFKHKDKKK